MIALAAIGVLAITCPLAPTGETVGGAERRCNWWPSETSVAHLDRSA
jgi:hypothetical protein